MRCDDGGKNKTSRAIASILYDDKVIENTYLCSLFLLYRRSVLSKFFGGMLSSCRGKPPCRCIQFSGRRLIALARKPEWSSDETDDNKRVSLTDGGETRKNKRLRGTRAIAARGKESPSFHVSRSTSDCARHDGFTRELESKYRRKTKIKK